MKHKVIALVVQKICLNGEYIEMPEGCIGVSMVFESKKTAIAHHGKDVKLIRVKSED